MAPYRRSLTRGSIGAAQCGPVLRGFCSVVPVEPRKRWAARDATVGSVIATRAAITPATVGVDIGCGMHAVRLDLESSQLPDSLRQRMTETRTVNSLAPSWLSFEPKPRGPTPRAGACVTAKCKPRYVNQELGGRRRPKGSDKRTNSRQRGDEARSTTEQGHEVSGNAVRKSWYGQSDPR